VKDWALGRASGLDAFTVVVRHPSLARELEGEVNVAQERATAPDASIA
jgi:hypothetical protein